MSIAARQKSLSWKVNEAATWVALTVAKKIPSIWPVDSFHRGCERDKGKRYRDLFISLRTFKRRNCINDLSAGCFDFQFGNGGAYQRAVNLSGLCKCRSSQKRRCKNPLHGKFLLVCQNAVHVMRAMRVLSSHHGVIRYLPETGARLRSCALFQPLVGGWV